MLTLSSTLLQLEIRMAVVKQEMTAAASEERFEEAAELRDRLENLRLKLRCFEVQHSEDLRNSIRYSLGETLIFSAHPASSQSQSVFRIGGYSALGKRGADTELNVFAQARSSSIGDTSTEASYLACTVIAR